MAIYTGVLGLDPGLKCGWAYMSNSGMISGVWYLKKPGAIEGAGMPYIRLVGRLDVARDNMAISLVAYEQVNRHLGTRAAHVYGSITGHIQSWCDTHAVPYEGIPVAHVKQRATGKGNAKKEAMVEAANRQWPDAPVTSDDEADARFIALMAWETLTRGS